MARKRTKLEDLIRNANGIKSDFDACQNYKREKGILNDAVNAVDFYEGRQWKESKTKLPFQKPVINVIQNMVDEKVASILNKSWKVNYIVNDDMTLTDKVNKFTEWQMNELDQDTLNYYDALSGLLKGSWFNYFYWNEDKEGQMGVKDGGVEASCIDIQDIAVANPRQKNIQKQDWIIIRTRESVKSVKELAVNLRNDEKEKLIVGDGRDSIYKRDNDQTGEELVNVYTRFFRNDGEVYFEKATSEVVFQEARALNPLVTQKMLEMVSKGLDETQTVSPKDNTNVYKTDASSTLMKTDDFDAHSEKTDVITTDVNLLNENPENIEVSENENIEERFKANEYPITFGCFIERDNCIFGISWVAQLIAPQKNINQLLATTLLTATKWTMPALVAKEGALGTQKIDMSKPGGIITDYSPGGVDGIKVLNYGTMPTAHYELAQSLTSLLKDVYRTNDILNDGRNTSKGMSGYAMNLITSIQEKPIAQWQQKLARSIGAEGRVLEMFYKLYYRNKKFSYKRSDAEILAEQSQRPGERIPVMSTATFDGAEYLDTPFNVMVEVGESAKFNETSFVSLIETLFLNGTIEKLSPETLDMYVTMMPDSLFPKKGEFKLLIKQKEQGIINQLSQAVEQKDQAIEALQAQLQELGMRQQMKEKEMQNNIASYNAQLRKLQQQNDYNRYLAGSNNASNQAKNGSNTPT